MTIACGSAPDSTPSGTTYDTGPVVSRRRFLSCATLSGIALATLGHPMIEAQTTPAKRFKIVGFTKPFQNLNFEDTADLVAEVGWDGIECPVRANGQILPERVEDDLPRMVEALRKRKLELAIMATDVQNTTQPLTQKVLRAASKLGIRHYRLGFMHYRTDAPIPRQLDEIRAGFGDLVALNKELGLCGGLQNHSGADNVGAPVWDIYQLVKDFEAKYLSVFFDIAHATLEGGLDWPLNARLTLPYWGSVYVKDFAWHKGTEEWKVNWCPLGEGMVQPAFFQSLVKSSFSGIICQHCEYELGAGKERIAAMQKDLRVLKRRLGITDA